MHRQAWLGGQAGQQLQRLRRRAVVQLEPGVRPRLGPKVGYVRGLRGGRRDGPLRLLRLWRHDVRVGHDDHPGPLRIHHPVAVGYDHAVPVRPRELHQVQRPVRQPDRHYRFLHTLCADLPVGLRPSPRPGVLPKRAVHRGFTYMADAFNLALLYMQQFSDPTRQRNMEIVTDGVSTNPSSVTLATVTTIKEDGILITALGTGPWVDPTELQLMASQPTAEHYASLANYNGLIAVASMLTSGCQPVIPNASQIAWMLWSPSPSPLPEASPTASSSPLPSHSPSTSPSHSASRLPFPLPLRRALLLGSHRLPEGQPGRLPLPRRERLPQSRRF
eukprot:TRINITY_DN256_c0_g1_i6.p3 TRINITY_DN256_c0_g1~~TRINITY_DN256_c0_g1_i6.p3  ORF type:complete len:332 (+),score=27.97 TRINITY_DN256_c0_g1_i6:1521-2516(+)